jgi:hypothetical protein
MPFVNSYYRRASGAGNTTPARSNVSVAVYDADGASLLRAGVNGSARDVAFSSTLPGGFKAATFTLPAARSCAIRPGLRVVINSGQQVLWWGWVEDVTRGPGQTVAVACLGPWQEIEQRLCSVAFTGSVSTRTILMTALITNCPNIGTDYSLIAVTSKNVDFDAGFSLVNKKMTEVVDFVCAIGNSSGQRLLFALRPAAWQPNTTAPRAALWPVDLTAADYLFYGEAELTESTRTLANYVMGSYGSLLTSPAQDATSQGLYRRRDMIVAGGDDLASAEQMRDGYLAAYKNPLIDSSAFTVRRVGDVQTLQGAPVRPEALQAGDRLRIMDWAQGGTRVVMLQSVSWQDGVASCQPERAEDAAMLLAG